MDHHSPHKLIEEVHAASIKKAGLDVRSMLLKGWLSGALLALSTMFAFRAFDGLSGGVANIVAGVTFPVGFAIIVLLGLELVTGNFAVLTMGVLGKKTKMSALLRNWCWVYVGNFLGSVFVGGLMAFALTKGFLHEPGPIGDRIVEVACAKTLTYQHDGANGWMAALVKGVLCNWLVALGTILGLVSSSTVGKVLAVWLPIATFFALALEHSVVNMFVIPTGMFLGADISVAQWLLWNQLPVTLGNVIGGAVFTGALLHYSHKHHHPAY
ncbi:MAG: formate/nitrite transporter family protein [Planctomycetes bacterium]|jgi:formate/nitrite transporter|nr:formate/nitrite transporter family protein [Planctomycetota bacterium]